MDFITDTFNWLNNLNSGAALAILGWVGYIFRQIPEKIWNLIDQNFSVTIQITNDFKFTFFKTCDWLSSHCPKLHNHISSFREDRIYGETSIADGFYTYMLDWATMIIINKTQINQHGSDYVKYNIHIKMIGLNRKKYLEEYVEEMKKDKPSQYIECYIKGHRSTSIELYKKQFDDIYLDIIPQLKDILDKFIVNKSIYEKHGITYKLGICLYGPGGVGKSILCRAIATYLNWGITIIKNLGTSTNFEIDDTEQVVVLEELDLYCNLNREEMEKRAGIAGKIANHEPDFEYIEDYNDYVIQPSLPQPSQAVMLQNLLTFLDGLDSPNNCIIVATTNYIDRIDPILLRPGRFDYKFELTYMNREKAIQMCNNFNVPVDFILTDDIEFPCSPAVVQNKILHYITEK